MDIIKNEEHIEKGQNRNYGFRLTYVRKRYCARKHLNFNSFNCQLKH